MKLADLFQLQPAPIYGQFVRRVLLLNLEGRDPPDRSAYRLSDAERQARKSAREAKRRERRRDKHIAYMRDYNKRIRELTREELDRVGGY